MSASSRRATALPVSLHEDRIEAARRRIPPPATGRRIGRLLADTTRLYAQYWRTFLPAVLLLEFPLLILKTAGAVALDPGPAALSVPYVARALPFLVVLNGLDLLEALVAFVLMGIVARQVVDAFRGQPTALAGAFHAVLPRLWDLLGGSVLLLASVGLLTLVGVFLVSVLTLVFVVIAAGPGGLAGALARGLADQSTDLWLNLALLLPIVGLVLFLVVKWSLMVQVVVLEAGSPWGALRRSWRLVRGSFWRVLGTLLLGALPLTLLQNGPTLVQTFSFGDVGPSRGAAMAVFYALALALRLLILPWMLVLVTLLYFDLRARHGEPPLALDAQPPT